MSALLLLESLSKVSREFNPRDPRIIPDLSGTSLDQVVNSCTQLLLTPVHSSGQVVQLSIPYSHPFLGTRFLVSGHRLSKPKYRSPPSQRCYMPGQKSSEGGSPQRLGSPQCLRLTGSGMLVCFWLNCKTAPFQLFHKKMGINSESRDRSL